MPRDPPRPAMIRTRALTKRFGRFTAVEDLNLSVAPGEVYGLLGSNGAGKSTAIRMLCGLLKPTSGEAFVGGVDVARFPEKVKAGLGYMTQRFSLYDELTVKQNLDFYGGIYGLRGRRLASRQEWAIETASLAGKEHLLTRDLPGGWKQRLALACAILHEPRILFLDEPTGGVDPFSRRQFWMLIDRMSASGVTVLVTTHFLDEAEHCGRVGLMHAGRLVSEGPVAELKRVFAGRDILEIICPQPVEAQALIEALEDVRECSVFGARLHAVVTGGNGPAESRIRQTLEASGNGPVAISRIVPSLEDVFIHTMEAADAEATARIQARTGARPGPPAGGPR